MSMDRIEKNVLLKAPVSRVWRAIGDAQEFGRWFGVRFAGPFVVGATVAGRIVPTEVDSEVARTQEPYRGLSCDVFVERLEPERVLAFRWHPGADPASEPNAPTTLVTFELQAQGDQTLLTITETGFDAIPLARRAKVFAENEGGWEAQSKLIAKYVDGR